MRRIENRTFTRTIGIDYSGEGTPVDRLPRLRVYRADGNDEPEEIRPHENRQINWTRREIAECMVEQLRNESTPTLVGIDHAFSFPINYFERYNLELGNWSNFLEDFVENWPMDQDNARVINVLHGQGQARVGEPQWRRATERHTRTARPAFVFQGQGQVGHATHAGIPQLRYIRNQLGENVHFWPFDGWQIPSGKSAIAEVYPALWSHRFTQGDRNKDQHDAYSVAAWLAHADQNSLLQDYLNPTESEGERDLAMSEGWILGALGLIH